MVKKFTSSVGLKKGEANPELSKLVAQVDELVKKGMSIREASDKVRPGAHATWYYGARNRGNRGGKVRAKGSKPKITQLPVPGSKPKMLFAFFGPADAIQELVKGALQ